MRTALLTTATLVLIGIAVPSVLGFMWPDYSAAKNYLSELGAIDAPHAYWMNFFGFVPLSILWAISLLMLLRIPPKGVTLTLGVLLLIGTSISYMGAAIFPCDTGCPLEGSQRQFMHNAIGVIGYITAPPGLALLGAHYMKTGNRFLGLLTLFAAASALLGFLALGSSEAAPMKGAWQRLADFSLFFWIFAAALLVTKDSTQAR